MEKIEILKKQTYLIGKLHQWVDEMKREFSGTVEYESLCWCNRNLAAADFRIMDKIRWEEYLKEKNSYERKSEERIAR